MQQILDLLDVAAKSYPIKALAPELDKAESTLRNELTEQPGYKLGLRTALLIIKITRNFKPLDAIENLFGRVSFFLPKAIGSSLPVMNLAGRLTREFGEHMEVLSKSLEDGELTTDEAEKCLKELKDVITACLRLQGYIENCLK